MNLCAYLENSARNYPHKVAVRHEGDQLTFDELNRRCNRLAHGLKDLGLTPGDACVVMMPNHIDVITVYYALTKMGAVIIPVNFLFKQHELAHIFADAQPKAFIGSAPYLDEIRRLWAAGPQPSIRLAQGISDDPLFMNLADVYTKKDRFEPYPSNDHDTLKILYTSGTTGVPKGVMLTHANMASEARILAEMRGSMDPHTVVIGVLPLYHVYGITSVLNVSLYLGLTIELFTQFDPEKVITVSAGEEQTILFAVPTMYNRLIQIASQTPPRRSSLKFCISGGASLPVEFMQRFETLFSTKLYEGYGLTEAPVCVENPYGGLTKPGSIGLPIPEFSARIVDIKGEAVLTGEPGELLIKGPGVMKGYFNKPKETLNALKDGWLFTGDIARSDADGYIYIVDRKKDLIIRAGYNVYPREIEEVLYQIPEILETAVIGVAHTDLGEEIAAVVVLAPGAQIDKKAIQNYVKERVAPYKYPRIIEIVQEPLPKSGTGKILKKEIKKEYRR